MTNSSKVLRIPCPGGKRAIGVGYDIVGGGGDVIVNSASGGPAGFTLNGPSNGEVVANNVLLSDASVTVTGAETQGGFTRPRSIFATAVCADALPGLRIGPTSGAGAGSSRGAATPNSGRLRSTPAVIELIGVEARLADPDLSPPGIAVAHRISVPPAARAVRGPAAHRGGPDPPSPPGALSGRADRKRTYRHRRGRPVGILRSS